MQIIKPNLLASGIFAPDKDCSFALLKEFFVKNQPEAMTTKRVYDMLNQDLNNMLSPLQQQSDRLTERFDNVKKERLCDRNQMRELISHVSRLNQSVKHIIDTERSEKIMLADLDALKNETITTQNYLTEKVNMHNNRMVEFEVRVKRLENNVFVKFEKMNEENARLF